MRIRYMTKKKIVVSFIILVLMYISLVLCARSKRETANAVPNQNATEERVSSHPSPQVTQL